MSLLQKVSAPKLQLVALLLLAIYPVAIIASRMGLWSFKHSFLLFIIAAVLGFVVLVISLLKMSTGDRQDSRALVIALLVTLGPIAILGNSVIKAKSSPFIHDISTDVTNPPALVAAQTDRIEGDHSVEYAGTEVSELQLAGYPDLKSAAFEQSAADVFATARAAIEQNGWAILAENNQILPFTIEAVDTSLLFGFKDDIVVRISAAEAGSVVDVRSMSRVGQSDLGANAKRIQKLLNQL
ncbi:MAG: hypothetical protein ACJA0E_000845 [Bermanella sp.]|jgi:uncharacterized protein (DUF1499 family)